MIEFDSLLYPIKDKLCNVKEESNHAYVIAYRIMLTLIGVALNQFQLKTEE